MKSRDTDATCGNLSAHNYVIVRWLSLPSIELDSGGRGEGREPIGDVHHPVVFRAPSLLRDVALRVHEGGHLEK